MPSRIPALVCTTPGAASSSSSSPTNHRHKEAPSVFDQGGPFAPLGCPIGVVIDLEDDGRQLQDCDVIMPAAVHQLLNRKEMLSNPEAMKAVRKEADGLVNKGTGDTTTVREAEATTRSTLARSCLSAA